MYSNAHLCSYPYGINPNSNFLNHDRISLNREYTTLTYAPATFQVALDIMLSDARWKICLVYLDDVIVFSDSLDEHICHLDQVLSLLRAAGV